MVFKMKSQLTSLFAAIVLIFGSVASLHAAVAIYEYDSVKYLERGSTRSEAEQGARSSIGSGEQTNILGGCERSGWYGHVIFTLPSMKEASFAGCGFGSRQELLEKLKSRLIGYGPFRNIKNVVSRYDDGRPGKDDDSSAALSRFKGFGCLAYSEYNQASNTSRYWLEYQTYGRFGERQGRFIIAQDATSLNAVTQCHPKYAPVDSVPRELLPL